MFYKFDKVKFALKNDFSWQFQLMHALLYVITWTLYQPENFEYF